MIGLKRLLLGLMVLLPVVAEAKEVRIATSFYPVYIMALNVAKDVPGVRVANVTPMAAGCLHDYSLTAADMRRLAAADIFFTNGAGMESFIETVARQFTGLRIVPLSAGIPLIRNADGTDNPHVWVSIGNAVTQVRNLGDAMARFDPGNAENYARNTEGYIRKLQALAEQMHVQLAPYAGRKIVTFHEAFPYFAREFDLYIAAVVERDPGSAPSAKDLAATIALIKGAGLKVLFAEPQYSAYAAETIARQTGAKVFSLDPVVTGPDSLDAYETIMRGNLLSIINAFEREP
ncbi:MAG: metal ABC transporter substrate-binding protein [Candidatus Omnitrophota bacterium]